MSGTREGGHDTAKEAYLTASDDDATLDHKVRFGIEYMHMDPLKWFGLVVVVPWLILLAVMEIGKVVMDGPFVHYSYFTNWMLTVNLIYYTGYLVALLDYTGTLLFVWLFCVFWVFFANVIQVFLLVRVLLWFSPRLMENAVRHYGWSVALTGDWVVHVSTAVVAIIHAICIHQDLIDVLARFVLFTWRDWLFFVAYLVGEYLCAAAVLLGYCANFDFHHVYHVHIEFWAGLVMVAIIYVFAQTVPMLFMSPLSARWRAHAYRPSSRNALVLEAIRARDKLAFDAEEERVDEIRVI